MKRTFTLLTLLAVAGWSFGQNAPSSAAADPTADAGNVVSMFSDTYTDVNVTTWRTGWSNGQLLDTMIGTNNVKKYYDLGFVGVETTGADILDASGMEYVHFDLWSLNADTVLLKLVSFGADKGWQGGDDTEHEVTLTGFNMKEWVNFKIPLSDFTGLDTTAFLAQYIISGRPFGSSVIYIDNMYFSKDAPEAVPTTAAADPTASASDVISLFSGAYTDVTVNTWRTDWSAATLEDMKVDGNDVKKYSMLDFVGIETTGANLVDASEMTHVNFDLWTPNAETFRIKIVDFGADGAFQGGDDSEHEIAFDGVAKEEWVNFKIPFDSFTGLNARANLAQYIFSALPSGEVTAYIDNVFFSKEASGSVQNAASQNIKIYPNPASSLINIDLTKSTAEIRSISVLDIQGRIVLNNELAVSGSNHAISLEGVQSGIYFLLLEGETASYTQRIMVK